MSNNIAGVRVEYIFQKAKRFHFIMLIFLKLLFRDSTNHFLSADLQRTLRCIPANTTAVKQDTFYQVFIMLQYRGCNKSDSSVIVQ